MPDTPVLYATPADMAGRFGLQELIGLAPLPDSDSLDACGQPVFATNWPQATEEAVPYDEERLSRALEQASREADSYLAVRLTVPLKVEGGAPEPLKGFVCDMARYHLTSGFGMQDIDTVAARYKAAIAWLRDVAKGSAELIAPEPPEDPQPQEPIRDVFFFHGRRDCFF